MPGPTLELLAPEAQAAGGRSALYRALARGFCPPSPGFHRDLQAGQVAQDLRQAASALPYALATLGELPSWSSLSYETLESAYLALFEVGGEHGSPCFLYEGENGGGRMKVLEEVLRFYHYFGLGLAQEKRERPDHLATELEFMHALTFREAAALAAGRTPAPLRKAQRDFLRLHLEGFTTTVAGKIQSSGAPFYPDLAGCAASFCQRELAYLEAGA